MTSPALRLKKRHQTGMLLLLSLVLPALYFACASRNPYPDVEWVEDWPGAGDRYRTFTPVLQADHTTAVGPTVGADYAALSFADVDHDGVKEAIVASDGSFTVEEFAPERHTLRYQHDSAGRPVFTLLQSE